MDTYFFCQNCDAKITMGQLALLDDGKCPSCNQLEGFSTLSKSEVDPFKTVAVINDAQLFEEMFDASDLELKDF